eukprot:Gb_16759 [translate_table: standard]
MEAAIGPAHKLVSASTEWEEAYRPLPLLYFGFLMVWSVLVCSWTLNTWNKRRWQTSNLQWVLTIVPIMKALVLGLSFLFWYSCLNLSMCSFWVAFGVFVTRIFYETACFVAFLLISHGYCIMHEQLSISERRTTAGLASILYLTLTGYKAAVPQFAVFVMLIYLAMLYVIFLHLSRNISVLREQLQNIQEGGVQIMHMAVRTKYTMFKKFKSAMLLMVLTELLMHTKTESMASEYWIHLFVRECAEIGIFFFIGWTFRSREMSPFFTVIPTLKATEQRSLPPIYSIEMNEKDFNNLDFKEWHIGVPTSTSRGDDRRPMLVIVLQPSMSNLELSKDIHSSKEMPRIIEKSFGHNSSFYNGKRSSLSQTCSSSLASDCTLTVEGRSQTSSQNSFSRVPNGTNETKYYKMKKTLNPIAMPLRRVA